MAWFALPIVYTIAVLAPLDCIEPRYTEPVYACLLVMAAFTARNANVFVRRRFLRGRRKSAIAAVEA